METFAPSADSSGAEDSMLLLSWNVKFHPPGYEIDNFGSLIDKIKSVRPQIVTLQEVKRNLADEWADRLDEIGLKHHYRSGNNALALSHQCVIASKWKLTPNDIPRPREPPYPESLGRATVSVPGESEREIDVFTAHIPNAVGNGWRKIDTFRVLEAELRRAIDSPRILTGDFNEPQWCPELEKIKVWGDKGGGAPEHWRDKFGDVRSSIEWANAVRSVLDDQAAEGGLRDAYRDCHRPEEHHTPATYCTRGSHPKCYDHKLLKDCTKGGNPKCYDHTLVSRHFDVLDCGYHHEWREKGLSDHSPMWTRLRLRSDLPELE